MTRCMPIELVEQIIGHVHDDAPALGACALVHSSWTTASQAHIFYTMDMTNDADPDPELDAILNRWLRLFTFLDTQSHIRTHIQHLLVDRFDPSLAPHLSSELFPRVHTLTWKRYYQPHFLAHLPRLESLELRTGEWRMPAVLVGGQTGSANWGGTRLALKRLHMLCFPGYGPVQSVIYKWLATTQSARTLKYLKVDLPSARSGNISEFRNVLKSLTALRDLSLKIFQMLSDPQESLNLGVLPITRLALIGCHPKASHTPQLFRFFYATSFPALQHLSIFARDPEVRISPSQLRAVRVHHPDPSMVRANPLEGIDDMRELALPQPLAARLQTVDLWFADIDVLERATDFLLLFGAANRPGVLRVRPDTIKLVD